MADDRALIGTTLVAYESGRWAVYVLVVFPDDTVVRRIDDHHTRRRAELSADFIERAMNRYDDPPDFRV